MDYVHIVETNEAYSPDNISDPKDVGYLGGFDWAVRCAESCLESLLFDLDDGTLRSKLEAEVVGDVADRLKSWLEGDRAELIVSLIEGQPDEGE